MVSRNSRIPQDGLPLDEAAYELAPRRLKTRATQIQLHELPSIEGVKNSDAALEHFAQVSRIAIANIAAQNEPLWAMRNHLRDRLKKHDFDVTGIRISPAGRGEIESIPAHFFDGHPKIIWHKSILVNFGQRFERVRVCPLLSEQTANPRLIIRSNGSSKGGRPETKSLLRPILHELMQSEQFRLMQRKSQFYALRQTARRAHPEIFVRASQPSEDTMRAVMREAGLIKQ